MRRDLNREAKAGRVETVKVFTAKTVFRRINVRIGVGALLTILLLAVSLLPPASSALRRTLPPPTFKAKTVIMPYLGPPLLLKRSLNYLGVSSDDHITPLSPDVAETFDVLPGPVCNTAAPKTVFLLGETVCGRISSLGGNSRRLNWKDANGDILQTSAASSADPSTDLFVIPSTPTSTISGTVIDNRGQWTLQSIRNTNFSVQAAVAFYVRQSGSPVSSLTLTAGGGQAAGAPANTDMIFSYDPVNLGPDAATNASLTVTIPPNTTFVSMAPNLGNGGAGWTCAAPVGSNVTCTKPSMSAAPVTNPTQQEEMVLTVHVPASASNQQKFYSSGKVTSDNYDVHPSDNVFFANDLVTSGGATAPAINASGASLVNESCSPFDGAIDPGETVTLSLCVQNDGAAMTAGHNLIGTLLATGGVATSGVTANYGTVAGSGTLVCRNFTFTASNLACGSGLVPSVSLADGATNLGTVVLGSSAFPMASTTGAQATYSTSRTVVPSCCSATTAAEASVSGRILDGDGNSIEGTTIRLSGTENRMTITDAYGNYHFDDVTTGGTYTVTPSRANYSFSPSQRSFSQLGNHTEAAFNATAISGAPLNPLDTNEYFVRHQYLDFLGREPDEAGFNFWLNSIQSCGNDAACTEVKRIQTSAAFFFSIEFQQTGYEVYRIYKTAFGDIPGAPVPITLGEFRPDMQRIRQGVIVNQNSWETTLESNKQAFTEEFVQRARFSSAYPTTMNPTDFINALFAHADVTPSDAERATAVGEFGGAGSIEDAGARARAFQRVADSATVAQHEFDRAFVLMEYFGYLARDANAAPDGNYSGFDFWLAKLDGANGNWQQAEMVNSFLVSTEYRQRFPF